MRILVTGGAGYIGSILVPSFLAAKHEVTVVDTFSRGDTSLASSCFRRRFTAIKGDVRKRFHDHYVIWDLLEKHDVVIPLAAVVGAPACARDEGMAYEVNYKAVSVLGGICRKRGIKLIYPTTNSGYGVGTDEICTEETPLNPISTYGVTKCKAEEDVLHYGGVSLRLATVFGMSPRMRLDLLVNDFVYRAVKDRSLTLFEAHFRRNYIHVRDVARAFLHAIDNYEAMQGQAYNVGLSDANLSKSDLCTRIQQYVPDFVFHESPIGEDPDKRDYIVSNAKIEATGFKPLWSLDDGIRELIKGYTMLNNSRYSNV